MANKHSAGRPEQLLIIIVGLCAGLLLAGGCSSPTTHAKTPSPRFADTAPVTTTESWASIMARPGIEPSPSAMSRRDVALGMPPSGPVGVAGAWRQDERASIDRWLYLYLPRTERTLLFFQSPDQYESRRRPWFPRRAHPWHTAW